jgi:hypothetical protein
MTLSAILEEQGCDIFAECDFLRIARAHGEKRKTKREDEQGEG